VPAFVHIWSITNQIFVGTKSAAEKQNTYYGKYTFSVSVGVLHPNCYTVHAIHIHLGEPLISHFSSYLYILCSEVPSDRTAYVVVGLSQAVCQHEHSDPCAELFCIFVLFGSRLQFATLFCVQ
jgi:hypothetical protein